MGNLAWPFTRAGDLLVMLSLKQHLCLQWISCDIIAASDTFFCHSEIVCSFVTHFSVAMKQHP
jgi:hypothetical protein